MQWHRQLRWDPGNLGWRVAILFMVGSFVFALGSFPPYAQLVDPAVVGTTFVVGSLFFTSAGYSQFLQAINPSADAEGGERFRFWAWRPGEMVWWATFVQLIGTLFFNISTTAATIEGLSAEEANRLVWSPDFFGSIAFLVASHVAWLIVCQRVWCVRSDRADWWTAALNYTGSIFFMISALAAFTLPTTGEVINIAIVNSATFAGAACFFVGAYVLLPPKAASVHTANGRLG